MATHHRRSVQDILSWLRDRRPLTFASLDELSVHFGLTRDQMLKALQSLQRYECVKRGGRDGAEWSITELGLVRLKEGRFSDTGAFLSAYEERPRPKNTAALPAVKVEPTERSVVDDLDR